ncbi:MAG: CPBP family intramembrane glutamic endopeptidase, partial [Candidatus Acidiferrales bacterium]
AHLYQGRRGVITTFVVGLLFSLVRSWTGSLLAPLVAHFVADITAGLLAPPRLRVALAAAKTETPSTGSM